MRLWHQALLSRLPMKQLLGQHRECCALRGNGWGKPHSVVNYVFSYNPLRLFKYHAAVMLEMLERNYNVDSTWFNPCYRGSKCAPYSKAELEDNSVPPYHYTEHNGKYLQECKDNLASKGIII